MINRCLGPTNTNKAYFVRYISGFECLGFQGKENWENPVYLLVCDAQRKADFSDKGKS